MHILGTAEHTLFLEQLYGALFQPLYTVHLNLTNCLYCTADNNCRQAGLSRGFVDYSEIGEQIHRSQTYTHTRVPIESVPD